MQCYICKSTNVMLFLSLGNQPLSDAFLKKEDLKKPEPTFPLDVLFCPKCSLVQLGYAVEPDKMFREYVYTTGSNALLKKSFEDLVDRVVKTYNLQRGDLAIDIGSNDGTLLRNYVLHGIEILGVDPSSVGETARQNGIPTIVDYFTEDVGKKILREKGLSKVITATNVFAHVRELDSFMRGVLAILDDRGVFITESGYVLGMMEHMEYDCIYHEHLRYYSATSLAYLFNLYEMEIVSIEQTVGSSGHSIRVTAAKKGAYSPSPSVASMLKQEQVKKIKDIGLYRQFADRVAEVKDSLLQLLSEIKKQGDTIVGIGAPAKGNTLLNYCGIGPDYLEYLAETSPLKIGLFSPGMHIPVVDEKQLFLDQPNASLLLAWNYADILVPKLRGKGYEGKFIIPNPVPKLI